MRPGQFFYPTAKWVEPEFPMRIWFVGLLFSIGAFLFLYSGFSKKEDWLLNLAGIFAWGVAIFPMDIDPASSWRDINAHGVSAIALFVCMVLVVWLCARDTLEYVTDEKLRKRFILKYNVIGILMGVFPIIALIFTLILQAYGKHVFFIEAAGIWTFAIYWWVKSRELAHTGADKRALQAEIELNRPA